MKIFFDTEFIEDGNTIELISIGLVNESGGTYYAESAECDFSQASPWVIENVFPSLTGVRKGRREIAQDILIFAGERPEFWAYYASYDWVALCQLYGTMMQLPQHWPMFCRDLKQLADSKGNKRLMQKDSKHNALEDAKWVKVNWEALQ